MYTEKGMVVEIPYDMVEQIHKLNRKNKANLKHPTEGRLNDAQRLEAHIGDLLVSLLVDKVNIKTPVKK